MTSHERTPHGAEAWCTERVVEEAGLAVRVRPLPGASHDRHRIVVLLSIEDRPDERALVDASCEGDLAVATAAFAASVRLRSQPRARAGGRRSVW